MNRGGVKIIRVLSRFYFEIELGVCKYSGLIKRFITSVCATDKDEWLEW